jgi:hypothetical protein
VNELVAVAARTAGEAERRASAAAAQAVRTCRISSPFFTGSPFDR